MNVTERSATDELITQLLESLLSNQLTIKNVELRKIRPSQKEPAIVQKYRLHHILEGTAHYESEYGVTDARKGDFVFVPAWVPRPIQPSLCKDLKLAWVGFEMGLQTKPFDNLLHFKIGHHAMRKACRQKILNLHEWYAMPKLFSPIVLESELKSLLACLFTQQVKRRSVESSLKTTTSSSKEIGAVINYLEKHYADPQVLSNLQEQLNLSANYFRGLFKKHTKTTLNGYLNMIRMRVARYYIRESNMRIQEVSSKVGHEDAKYFSRLYKKNWGVAPTKDRGSH